MFQLKRRVWHTHSKAENLLQDNFGFKLRMLPWCSSKYVRMYLVYYIAITRVYAKPECTPMNTRNVWENMCARANQRCMGAVRANHDAHSSRLPSCVYTHALNMHFYIINLSCTCRLCCKHFQKCVESCSCLTCV